MVPKNAVPPHLAVGRAQRGAELAQLLLQVLQALVAVRLRRGRHAGPTLQGHLGLILQDRSALSRPASSCSLATAAAARAATAGAPPSAATGSASNRCYSVVMRPIGPPVQAPRLLRTSRGELLDSEEDAMGPAGLWLYHPCSSMRSRVCTWK